MDQPHPPNPEDAQEPPRLRTLRLMVTVLTGVMILGISTIVVLLALRLTAAPSAPALPEALTLPDGHSTMAVTLGTGWTAVVTRDEAGGEHILIFTAEGALRQQIPILP